MNPSETMRPPSGALEGLKVLDITHVIAGSWCSMMLADLGADVVKVEPIAGEITRGDPQRAFRPYDFVNRNKRAIAVDLSDPRGADAIRELAKTADVLVENYRPGVLDKLGLGYDALRELNPALIYCSISGFGQTGPYRERGGFDLVAQAMSGIMSCTGEPDGGEPMAAGVPISDLNAGVFGALAVLAALHDRDRSGLGQRVETSLLESAMAYTVWETGMYLTEGVVAKPAGSRHRLSAPYEALPTRDGYIVVGVNNQKLWARFCGVIGRPDLQDDPRFASPRDRVANREALRPLLVTELARADNAQWLEGLLAAGVPCGPINDIAGAAADPQVQSREFFVEIDGRKFARAPLGLSRTPVTVRRGPAAIGQHTFEVLTDAGFEPARIRDLAASGAVLLGAES
jgi:crotonobetainyl-CoA:carnitine CoA-transferase CaiB-like acyl-CoA transferase